MGTWYETCGLSQTPILPNDPVALIILLKTEFDYTESHKLFYPNDLYQPIAPAIYGTYQDYGELDPFHSNLSYSNFDRLLNGISERKIAIQKIRNARRGIKTKTKEYPQYDDMESLLDALYAEKFDGLSYVMIHEELYHQVAKYGYNDTQHFDPSLSNGEYLEQQLDEYLAIMEKYPDERSLNIDGVKDLYSKIALNHLSAYTQDFFSFFNNPALYVDNKALKKDFMDVLLLNKALQKNRIIWQPQSGKGSQDIRYDIASYIGDFAKKKQKEFKQNFDY